MVSDSARRVALVFPGQGSQSVGMGRAVHEAFPEARDVYERADRVLGEPLSRACFEGPDDALRLTATTQPAILSTSLAILAALRASAPGDPLRGVDCLAGHSLGEYTALVAAGAVELEDAVRIVRNRGRYMQEAVPIGTGAMAAVLGAPTEVVEAACREAAGSDVLEPANLNAPDQTVVAGNSAAVDRLAGLAKGRGIRKVVRLPVSAPFHCRLMKPAAERLSPDLDALAIRNPSVPVIANVDGIARTEAAELRAALKLQVTAAVRWVDCIRTMRARGITTIVEIGPGRVLTGLARRIDPELTLLNVEDPGGIRAALRAIEAGRPGGT